MKSLIIVIGFLVFAIPARSDDVRYKVLAGDAVNGGFLVGHVCTITAVDVSNPKVELVLKKNGSGPCPVLDAGTIVNAHRDKNKVTIMLDKKTEWSVISTISLP